MIRRDALRNIFLISAGVYVIPSCYRANSAADFPTYTKLPFDKNEWFLIDQISEAILPVKNEDEVIEADQTVVHFILQSINDCYSPEDQVLYKRGFDEFVSVVQEKYLRQTKENLEIDKISDEQLNELLKYMSDKSGANARRDFPKAQQYFFDTTKSLAVRHFKSSENYMKKQLDYEFAPGKYSGAVKI